MKRYGIIYLAVNKFNGKKYVGQTLRTLQKRITSHMCSGTLFHQQLLKYGQNAFKWGVLAFADNQEDLNQLEIHYIKFFNCMPEHDGGWGYNLDLGGKGRTGFSHSEETRLLMSKSHTGKKTGPLPETQRLAISKAKKGIPMPQLIRNKLTKAFESVSIPVIAENLKTGTKIQFNSMNHAARELNLDSASISRCIRGIAKKTAGWKFSKI